MRFIAIKSKITGLSILSMSMFWVIACGQQKTKTTVSNEINVASAETSNVEISEDEVAGLFATSQSDDPQYWSQLLTIIIDPPLQKAFTKGSRVSEAAFHFLTHRHKMGAEAVDPTTGGMWITQWQILVDRAYHLWSSNRDVLDVLDDINSKLKDAKDQVYGNEDGDSRVLSLAVSKDRFGANADWLTKESARDSWLGSYARWQLDPNYVQDDKEFGKFVNFATVEKHLRGPGMLGEVRETLGTCPHLAFQLYTNGGPGSGPIIDLLEDVYEIGDTRCGFFIAHNETLEVAYFNSQSYPIQEEITASIMAWQDRQNGR